MSCRKDQKENIKLLRRLKVEPTLKHLSIIFSEHSRSDLENILKKVKESMGASFWYTSMEDVISRVSDSIFPTNDLTKSEPIRDEVLKDVKSDHNSLNPCNICFDPINSQAATKLDCSHIFHYECLHKWLLKQNTCPMCRRYTVLDIDFPALF